MIDNILDYMKRRYQPMSRNGTMYRMLNKSIKKKCKQANDELLNEKCAELESLCNKNIPGKDVLK